MNLTSSCHTLKLVLLTLASCFVSLLQVHILYITMSPYSNHTINLRYSSSAPWCPSNSGSDPDPDDKSNNKEA